MMLHRYDPGRDDSPKKHHVYFCPLFDTLFEDLKLFPGKINKHGVTKGKHGHLHHFEILCHFELFTSYLGEWNFFICHYLRINVY